MASPWNADIIMMQRDPSRHCSRDQVYVGIANTRGGPSSMHAVPLCTPADSRSGREVSKSSNRLLLLGGVDDAR